MTMKMKMVLSTDDDDDGDDDDGDDDENDDCLSRDSSRVANKFSTWEESN